MIKARRIVAYIRYRVLCCMVMFITVCLACSCREEAPKIPEKLFARCFRYLDGFNNKQVSNLTYYADTMGKGRVRYAAMFIPSADLYNEITSKTVKCEIPYMISTEGNVLYAGGRGCMHFPFNSNEMYNVSWWIPQLTFGVVVRGKQWRPSGGIPEDTTFIFSETNKYIYAFGVVSR